MFAGFIYDGAAEAIEGHLIVGSDLDLIKNKIIEEINGYNDPNDGVGDYSWVEEVNGNNAYYPVRENIPYGGFRWGAIYPIVENEFTYFTD